MAWQNEDSLPRRINQSGTKKDEIGTGRSKSNSSSGIGDDHDISSQSSSSSSAASAFIAVDCPYHNHRPSRPRGRRRIESDTITIISKDNHLGDWTTMTEPPLPKDPRMWTRDDVRQWIIWLQNRHTLPAVDTSRFLMNGKALCLMSLNMFTYRVPLGGKLLYKDFQLRMSSALNMS